MTTTKRPDLHYFASWARKQALAQPFLKANQNRVQMETIYTPQSKLHCVILPEAFGYQLPHRTLWRSSYITNWMGSVLLQKLTGLQPAKEAFEFYGTRRFHHCVHNTLPPIRISEPDQTSPHPTSSRYSLILSSHLCTGLPSGLFPSDLLTKPWLHLSFLPYALNASPISFFLIWSPEQYLVRSTDHKAPIM